jgi:hypothetical protein
VVRYLIEDSQFDGGPPLGKNDYKGKSAIAVYGQPSPYHSIVARFTIEPAKLPPPGVPVTLTLSGVDSEDLSRTPMHIKLENTVGGWETLEEDPLPNDFPLRAAYEPNDNLPTHSWAIGPDKLGEDNVLTIENLDPNGTMDDPIFFAIDWAELSWSP